MPSIFQFDQCSHQGGRQPSQHSLQTQGSSLAALADFLTETGVTLRSAKESVAHINTS